MRLRRHSPSGMHFVDITVDSMHAADLGIFQDAIGSLMWIEEEDLGIEEDLGGVHGSRRRHRLLYPVHHRVNRGGA